MPAIGRPMRESESWVIAGSTWRRGQAPKVAGDRLLHSSNSRTFELLVERNHESLEKNKMGSGL